MDWNGVHPAFGAQVHGTATTTRGRTLPHKHVLVRCGSHSRGSAKKSWCPALGAVRARSGETSALSVSALYAGMQGLSFSGSGIHSHEHTPPRPPFAPPRQVHPGIYRSRSTRSRRLAGRPPQSLVAHGPPLQRWVAGGLVAAVGNSVFGGDVTKGSARPWYTDR